MGNPEWRGPQDICLKKKNSGKPKVAINLLIGMYRIWQF